VEAVEDLEFAEFATSPVIEEVEVNYDSDSYIPPTPIVPDSPVAVSSPTLVPAPVPALPAVSAPIQQPGNSVLPQPAGPSGVFANHKPYKGGRYQKQKPKSTPEKKTDLREIINQKRKVEKKKTVAKPPPINTSFSTVRKSDFDRVKKEKDYWQQKYCTLEASCARKQEEYLHLFHSIQRARADLKDTERKFGNLLYVPK
jgi:hypothetical protein